MRSPQARPRGAWTILLAVAIGCGGGDDGGDGSDAGTGTCDMAISVSPASPVAPGTLVVTATIVPSRVSVVGVQTFDWNVTFGNAAIPVAARDADGREVEVAADAAGTYRVALSGTLGGLQCTDAVEIINVRQPDAGAALYRLRLYPAAGQGAPVQQRVVEIPGGADFSLGTISLDTGVPVAGIVRDSLGAAVPAFVRLDKNGAVGWPSRELFADSNGVFSTRVTAGTYDVLVVPTAADIAPAVIMAATATSLASVSLPTGGAVDGSVVDSSAIAVVGASVSVRAGGAPSTIAATGPSGGFLLLAQPGAASVVVRPPSGSGLPRLELHSAQGLVVASGTSMAIAYAATTIRVFDLGVTLADGVTAAPAAQVTFVARPMANAGTVTPAGGVALDAIGHFRTTLIADGVGKLTGVTLPEAVYDLIITPQTGSTETIGLGTLDLVAGAAAPATVSLASTATVQGIASTSSGAGLADVRVSATPRGLLAGAAGAAATALTDADGRYSLQLVGGGLYTVSFVSPAWQYGRQSVEVTAPDPGDMVMVSATPLPDAIRVMGDISLPGVTSVSGVYLQLLCYECTGALATAPLAEAVSDTTGRFTLSVPDPGMGE